MKHKRVVWLSLIALTGGAVWQLSDSPFSPSFMKGEEACLRADSLSRLSYDLRYKDLAQAAQTAEAACTLADTGSRSYFVALNQLGFCAFMQMDFERAIRLFRQVLDESNDEIECLIAHVGMMKVCQRTSMNKEFYDHRSQALRHIKRIEEDASLLRSQSIRQRLNYAFSEFHIVSAIYFYYLQQHREALKAINSVTKEMREDDPAQQLYWEYMKGSGGMYEADSYDKLIGGELEYLVSCLLVSREEGFIYFEANAMQAIAELLQFKRNRELLLQQKSALLRMLNEEGLPSDSLPLHYAKQALRLFEQYGDWYQISGTHRTLAACYNNRREPEQALKHLQLALDYVNRHHEKYYHCTDTADRLRTFVPDQFHSVELQWIEHEGIQTVPEWILKLREQLSRTYSAMGLKAESDYNRNIYLDLLDYTRQDKALESRYDALAKETGLLNTLLVLIALGVLFLLLLFLFLNQYWKKRHLQHLGRLKQVFALCRKITSSVPMHTESTAQMAEMLEELIRPDFQEVFHIRELHLSVTDEGASEEENRHCPDWDNQTEGSQWQSYTLALPGTHEKMGTLCFTLHSPLKKEEKEWLQLVLPYLTWALKNGRDLWLLDDEKRQMEKAQYIHKLHLAENKRQNLVKKACFSIVTGMLPYIDRIVNEVHKLGTSEYALDETVRREKIVYIDELVTQINEYNDILALWVKMRQGALSLHIESFPLRPLFEVLEKGRRAFEMKQQTLSIACTESLVKADRALTLFMIHTLTENARKYTPPGGEIRLEAREGEGYVEISVCDNGPGLSAADIARLLDEKVYDSALIGKDSPAYDAVKAQKGHGFGLMNCKGIIEKYRKTNPLFQVCKLGIESTPGAGSRFFFRLPKSVRKGLGCVLAGLCMGLGSGCTPRQAPSAEVQKVPSDSLLTRANAYTNRVYECNVRGEYAEALYLADSVFYYMNRHCQTHATDSLPLLTMNDKNFDAAETHWFEQGFDTDYYILLDVRNEVAVAALALQDFKTYYYNNLAYATLYKQISKDRSLEQYCNRMQHSATNKQIAVFLLSALVLACLGGCYVGYVRPRLRHRYRMEQVFVANEALASFLQTYDRHKSDFFPQLLERLKMEVRELMPLSDACLAVGEDNGSSLRFYGSREQEERLMHRLERVFAHPHETYGELDGWMFFPLLQKWGDEPACMGVLGLEMSGAEVKEEDRILLELLVSGLTLVWYQAVVQIARRQNDVEVAQDDTSRLMYEENALHVQNMVLDNCLSTLKHETVYYPNRIKQLIDTLVNDSGQNVPTGQEALRHIEELIGYYKEIFTLLSSCAARQLEEITFRRSEIAVGMLLPRVQKYFRKQTTKLAYSIELQLMAEEGLKVVGDEVLLLQLLESLLDEAIRVPLSGHLTLTARRDGDFIRFDFTDARRTYPQEILNALFYPQLRRMQSANGRKLTGTEYLVCKQIIREHDEYGGRRGCRINAVANGEKGFTVWFTLPSKGVSR